MNTTFTLMQTAAILGVSFQQAQRLVRFKQLKPAACVNKVYQVDAAEIQAFIARVEARA
jgi:hypothetical protein